MDQQSQSFLKNAKLFTETIEDFEELIDEDEHIERDIGHVGGCEWRIRLSEYSDDDGVDYLELLARPKTLSSSLATAVSIEIAVCVKNEELRRWRKFRGRFEVNMGERIYWKRFMRMDAILEPNSGYLRDGALEVQVEVRVDVITDKYGMKRLNLFDPFPGSVKVNTDDICLYSSKKMLMFHSPVLAKHLAAGNEEVTIPREFESRLVDLLLQTVHGVKVRVLEGKMLDMLYLVHKFQFLSARRHCEVIIGGFSDMGLYRVVFTNHENWINQLIDDEYIKDYWTAVFDEEDDDEREDDISGQTKKILMAIARAPFIDRLVGYIDDWRMLTTTESSSSSFSSISSTSDF